MPKTEAEKRTLGHFKEEYGDRGERVYYALRNKNKKFDRAQGGGFSSKEKSEWWAGRLAKLPELIKAGILRTLKAENAELGWWTERLIKKAGKVSAPPEEAHMR